MRIVHALILPLLFALLASACHAAYVHGDIYSGDLQKVNKTLVRVEGGFSYQTVSDKANYSFYLPQGDYTVTASEFDQQGNLARFAEEKVRVGAEDQKVDLVLRKVATVNDYLFYVALVVVSLSVGAWFVFSSKKAKEMDRIDATKSDEANPSLPPAGQSSQIPPRAVELDDDAKKVLAALDSSDGRSTQKELGEGLGFSDAKLSLILSELDSLGYIRKFKRGRGNIIRKV